MAPARVFGSSLPGSFASFDPATLSWRTSQISLLDEASDGQSPPLAEFSETWPRQGMTRSGRCYRLQSSGHRTCESASGSWPTPHGMPKRGQRRRPGPSGNQLGRAVLAAEREMFPTPGARDQGRTPEAHMAMKRRMKGGERKTITSLAVLAKAGFEQPDQEATLPLFPTPTKGDSKAARNATANRSEDGNHNAGMTLTDFVTLWPTPVARDHKGPGMEGQLPTEIANQGTTGQLNPAWVEWLMGFPLEWTVLGLSATPSSLRSRSGSGDKSSTSREAT